MTELSERATRVVRKIIADLEDRSGLQQAWDDIDKPIQREIKAEWAEIIATEFSE